MYRVIAFGVYHETGRSVVSDITFGDTTLKVTQVGSSILNGDSDSVKVKIRK